MPCLKQIQGIKVEMYFNDHLPPHVHILYNEFEELIEIETFRTYVGEVPPKQRKLAVTWMEAHQDFLRNKWEEFH